MLRLPQRPTLRCLARIPRLFSLQRARKNAWRTASFRNILPMLTPTDPKEQSFSKKSLMRMAKFLPCAWWKEARLSQLPPCKPYDNGVIGRTFATEKRRPFKLSSSSIFNVHKRKGGFRQQCAITAVTCWYPPDYLGWPHYGLPSLTLLPRRKTSPGCQPGFRRTR